jgi:FMN phosphatase YigB (HAD superfamily)
VERLGDGIVPPDCLFVDDVEVNVEAARDLGMRTVHFQSNEQAIPEIRASLDSGS